MSPTDIADGTTAGTVEPCPRRLPTVASHGYQRAEILCEPVTCGVCGELIVNARAGNTAAVRRALAETKLDVAGGCAADALISALHFGHADIVMLLLAAGIPPTESAMYVASLRAFLAGVVMLVAAGGATPLRIQERPVRGFGPLCVGKPGKPVHPVDAH